MNSHSSGERLPGINGVELCVETELCERIAHRGRFVIRSDHRDTGRSTCYPPGRPEHSFNDLLRHTEGSRR